MSDKDKEIDLSQATSKKFQLRFTEERILGRQKTEFATKEGQVKLDWFKG